MLYNATWLQAAAILDTCKPYFNVIGDNRFITATTFVHKTEKSAKMTAGENPSQCK